MMQVNPSLTSICQGETLSPTIKFNPFLAPSLGYESLSHCQISINAFDPHVVASMNQTQIKVLLLEKSKLGFDKLDHALSIFQQMVRIRHGLEVINFNQLLTAIAKMKHYSTVISLYKEIRAVGIPIDDRTLSILVNCFCRLNQVQYGFAILGIFYKCGYIPGVGAFNTLINGYILEDKIDEAVELFGRLIKNSNVKPDEITYATIMKGLCKVGNIEMTVKLLRSMQKCGCRPTVEMYSTIMDNLCKDGNVDDALRFLSEMREWDVMPNVFTYNSLIHGLCNSGRWKDATRMLRDMTEQNVLPNVITFNTLIHALCNDGMTKEAECILNIMIQRGEKPDILTYNSLIGGYCLQGRMDKAKEVFNSSVDTGLEPNIYSYNILINGYCQRMNIDEALNLFREMPRKGLKPATDTYNTLLKGLLKTGSCDAADSIVHEMICSSQNPDILTFSVLVDGFFKNHQVVKAVEVFCSMEDHGIVPNIVVYNILLNGLCKAGKIEDAWKLFGSFSSKGLKPNVKTYTAMISGLCDGALVDKAEKLLLLMEKDECPPNSFTYNVIARAFLERGDRHKVMAVLQEMIKRSFSLDTRTLSMLMDSLTVDVESCKMFEMIQKLLPRPKLRVQFSIFGFMMPGSHIPINVAVLDAILGIYNTIIGGLCAEALLDEAEEILLQMERDGWPPNDLTYNVVVRAFLKRGDKSKVKMLLQEMINRNFSPDASNTATLIGDCDYLEMIQNLVSRDRKALS